MEYKRLTFRKYGAVAIEDDFGNTISPYDNTIYNALYRLAEIEDKIEQGTLIELPCIIVGNGAIDAFGKNRVPYYQVLWLDEFGIVKVYKTTDKNDAEKRLEELQNG